MADSTPHPTGQSKQPATQRSSDHDAAEPHRPWRVDPARDGRGATPQPTAMPPSLMRRALVAIFVFMIANWALAVQALAMLDARMGAMDARALVDDALNAKNQDGVIVDRLREADAALARGNVTAGRRELEAAFNPDDRHLIRSGFTGTGGDGRLAIGIVGAVVFAAAILVLFRQTRSKAPPADRPGRGGVT